MKNEDLRKIVRKKYSKIAKEESSCCGVQSTCECGDTPEAKSKKIGYTEEELSSIPKGANMGLGCGNPVALASLKDGEMVLDLGSGGGFDAFLAARRVGEHGKVIGVDMTPEMLEKARANAKKGKFKNVEFRLGEIENLPVADNSVNVIISNCVINLSPDKKRVFNEAHRVLRDGGRLMISDIVLLEKLPDFLKNSVEALTGCVAGAMLKDDYIGTIKKAGFKDVSVVSESVYPIGSLISDPKVKSAIKKYKISREQVRNYAKKIVSIKLSSIK
jgi:ubiquinone/menaquinone biosynthesis C-methylase UbiE